MHTLTAASYVLLNRRYASVLQSCLERAGICAISSMLQEKSNLFETRDCGVRLEML